MKRWDIFCRIVDNFGDIGICWRLSRQLAHEHGIAVRLFTDHPEVASKLITGMDSTLRRQTIAGVEVLHWAEADTTHPAETVLETFGGGLPEAYQARMLPHTQWINLEYLSAEPWVADFHARPSKHPTLALTKHYFFPGFTEATGGLIRELALLQKRDTFLSDTQLQQNFWQQIAPKISLKNSVKVSLFCYPTAPVKSLLDALAQEAHAVDLFVPHGNISQEITRLHPDTDLSVGASHSMGNLTLHVMPFLSQADYDQLLWSCDLNFVRGEDSWIRALWAGKPFVWQPYIQAEETHVQKLQAFLDQYLTPDYPGCTELISQASHAWSSSNADPTIWHTLIRRLPELHAYSQSQTTRFSQQADLATKLVIFSENLKQNQV